MPDQNNKNDNQTTGVTPIGVPSLPADYQVAPAVPPAQTTPTVPVATTTTTTTTQTTPISPSAPPPAPTSSGPTDVPTLTTPPKKKFGGGRIIATILGLFLLVGGIGAGIILTQQQQLFQQKASTELSPNYRPGENGGICLQCLNGVCVAWDPTKPNPGNGPCTYSGGCMSCNSSHQCVVTDYVGCTNSQNCTATSCAVTNTCGPIDALNGYCTPPPSGGSGCLATGCPSGQICHCQGGVACNYGVCVPDSNFHTACEGDGRVVCGNPNNPQAVTCCADGYVCGSGGNGCVPGGNNNTPPPGTGSGNTASCTNVKAYSTSWTALTNAQLSGLSAGSNINFCVTGSTTGGSFDKGRFKINGTMLPDTTTKRPNSNDYCQAYTIPANTSSFTVVADIHHATLGWR